MRQRCTRTVIPALAALAFCAGLLPGRAAAQTPGIRAELVTGGLTQPLFVTAPAGDTRLFVVERAGRIRLIKEGAPISTFLDITSKVLVTGECGFLGMTFAPDYASSGEFYVYYIELDGDSVLSRFTVSANPDIANTTETKVLEVDQPAGQSNHKGGTVAFGSDGFLYWALGDGGGQNDPAERAQNGGQLLGKILRLDVADPPAPDSIPVPGAEYAIPASNPFVGGGNPLDEIWALGLRNPFRWSFDRLTQDMWIADVGQNAIEEINFEPASDPGGTNWGWDVMEGTTCNTNDPAPSPPCNSPLLTLPIHQYSHSAGRCSITGGYVLRAPTVPVAQGLYFYADYCTGEIWSLNPGTLQVINRTTELAPAGGSTSQIVGFGEDGMGELYIVLDGSAGSSNGSLYRIALRAVCSNGQDDDGDGLTDYPADPGCANADSAKENPQCNDLVDNDGDSLIDLNDPGCMNRPFRNKEGNTGCGIGFELALLLPALAALRRRGRAQAH
jgi:glucose/arabinose dehydrogenase